MSIKDDFDKFAEAAVKAFNELRKALAMPTVKPTKPKYPHYKPLYKKVINGGWKRRFKGARL